MCAGARVELARCGKMARQKYPHEQKQHCTGQCTALVDALHWTVALGISRSDERSREPKIRMHCLSRAS